MFFLTATVMLPFFYNQNFFYKIIFFWHKTCYFYYKIKTMAEITLKFDARNPIAKKTLDYILSLGVFTTNNEAGLNKPVLNELTPKQLVLINKLKKIKKQINNGTLKTRPLSDLLNEL